MLFLHEVHRVAGAREKEFEAAYRSGWMEAADQTMRGAGRYPEVTLMQRVHAMPGLVRLLTTDMPEEMARPGNWMHDALEYRDQWRRKTGRAAARSPPSRTRPPG